MFLEIEDTNWEIGEKKKINPILLNLKDVMSITIGEITGTGSYYWFGKELRIEYSSKTYHLLQGYSDEDLQKIYDNIVTKIKSNDESIYKIQSVSDEELFKFTIFPDREAIEANNINKYELLGNKKSIQYLKDRFSIRKCSERLSESNNAVYFYNTETGYVRVSSKCTLKSRLEYMVRDVCQYINDGKSGYTFS